MENSLKKSVDNVAEKLVNKNSLIVDNILFLIFSQVFLIFSRTFPHTYPQRLWISRETIVRVVCLQAFLRAVDYSLILP